MVLGLVSVSTPVVLNIRKMTRLVKMSISDTRISVVWPLRLRTWRLARRRVLRLRPLIMAWPRLAAARWAARWVARRRWRYLGNLRCRRAAVAQHPSPARSRRMTHWARDARSVLALSERAP